ncbi:MAG TPA: CoA ester lyase [Acidimicrobiales bacterium]|nr:CoA ester lyase [Acidimicrobiales bacterium]
MSASDTAGTPAEQPDPPRSVPRMRSLLFVPATRPDMVAKTPRSNPDAVVIDLEDAVPPGAKVEARELARESSRALARSEVAPAVMIRVNSVPGPWFEDDIESLTPAVRGIVVPKVESPEHVDTIRTALSAAGLGELIVLVGLETAAGVAACREVARHRGVDACYFGAEDYTADMGGPRRPDNLEVLHARSEVALAARLGGVAALDQIVVDFSDDARFESEAALARSLGFHGKMCIHPRQVPLANDAFVPSAEEAARARALLLVYDRAVLAGKAVCVFDGQMIDEPLARQARSILELAGE